MKTAYYKITLFLFLIAAIFVARLVYLQLLTDRYALNAANTSIKIDYVIPQRGIIFDRNGKILVGNQPSYEISFTQSQMTPDFDTLGFCNLLKIDKKELIEKIRKATVYSPRLPSVFLAQLNKKEYAAFQEKERKFEGF